MEWNTVKEGKKNIERPLPRRESRKTVIGMEESSVVARPRRTDRGHDSSASPIGSVRGRPIENPWRNVIMVWGE